MSVDGCDHRWVWWPVLDHPEPDRWTATQRWLCDECGASTAENPAVARAIELARELGLDMQPWQERVMRAVMDDTQPR